MKISDVGMMSLDDYKFEDQIQRTSTKKDKNDTPLKTDDALKVAKDFETLFLEMMTKSMRQTVPKTEESNAESIYTSMLDSEYSRLMADNQSFGIRDLVYNWMVENGVNK